MFLDMDQLSESPQQTRDSRSLEGFFPLVSITEGCGIVLLILMGVWISYYRDGYSWRSDPKLEFNWHPLLMIIGLVYLYSNGICLKMIFSHYCAFTRTIYKFPFRICSHASLQNSKKCPQKAIKTDPRGTDVIHCAASCDCLGSSF